jgi:hypothetical protein
MSLADTTLDRLATNAAALKKSAGMIEIYPSQ